ncbi:tRNA guanosine(34) transglycosylase Tgt [Candidatus Daviesbacteria bacterium]|nr:tRNA guanosine(34) transglycosylase Tgt [Candidatus Daviesbacteria bacterium]
MVSFRVLQKDGKARAGKLETSYGVIETPNFIPVGTRATVKALSSKDLKQIGVQVVLANTYHLMLRPGADLIEKMGGLHQFMSWDQPVMADSGGFQVFSLGVGLQSGESKVFKSRIEDFQPKQRVKLAKVTEEGVTFYSHLDGSKHFLGPEQSIKIQKQLGVDLMVAFDDHESITQTKEEMLKSLELTERWALRSKESYRVHVDDRTHIRPLLYGVVHGGLQKDLRIRSALFTDQHFEALAIGGIYGERKDLYQIIDLVVTNTSDEKIRHLLGIGEVVDLFEAIERGIDLFDCVAPTRRARNGSIYILPKNGGSNKNSFTLNIALAKFFADPKPLDPSCLCYTCQNFSRSYLAYLYKSGELLYHFLATYHNVYFIINLVANIRKSLQETQFTKLKKEWLR